MVGRDRSGRRDHVPGRSGVVWDWLQRRSRSRPSRLPERSRVHVPIGRRAARLRSASSGCPVGRGNTRACDADGDASCGLAAGQSPPPSRPSFRAPPSAAPLAGPLAASLTAPHPRGRDWSGGPLQLSRLYLRRPSPEPTTVSWPPSSPAAFWERSRGRWPTRRCRTRAGTGRGPRSRSTSLAPCCSATSSPACRNVCHRRRTGGRFWALGSVAR